MKLKLAYYYPGFHAESILFEGFREGWTEWDLVRSTISRFPGHYQPRTPAWGYEDESSPAIMTRKLRTAAAYGLDALVFIGYWYRNAPVADRPLRVALDAAVRPA